MNEEKRWNKNTIQKNLGIALVVICLVTIFNMNQSIKSLQHELSTLRQETNQLQSSLSGQIAGISENVEASLKKENSIISDYSYQVQSDKINRQEMTMPLNLTVRPKEHKDGLKTTFIIETEDGKTISAQGQEGEAYSYTASIVVPMDDYLKLSVTIDDGTLQKSEKLEEIYQIFDSYIMNVDSGLSLASQNFQFNNYKNKLEFGGTIETNISSNFDGSNYPVSGEAQILKNGKAIKTLPIQIEENYRIDTQNETAAQLDAAAASLDGSSITYYTDFNEIIKYNNNDLIEIVVIVKDNYGFQYKQIIHSERIDSDGNTYPTNYSNEVVVD